jgi:hypothetical protein
VVKPVDKKLCGNHLRKAEEMLDVAQYAIGASKSNAAVVARSTAPLTLADSVCPHVGEKMLCSEHGKQPTIYRVLTLDGYAGRWDRE